MPLVQRKLNKFLFGRSPEAAYQKEELCFPVRLCRTRKVYTVNSTIHFESNYAEELPILKIGLSSQLVGFVSRRVCKV